MFQTSQRLSAALLPQLSARIATPTYERGRLRSGIVHIGAGGFNRSHLAVYLDDLLVQGRDLRWGEYGVGLLPGDLTIHDALAAQDYLYGVLQRDDRSEQYRVIGSLTSHAYAPHQASEVIATLASPECAIISLTVTEGGYFEEAATGEFFAEHPDIVHDLVHPERPRTWLGFVAKAAQVRRRHGASPFTLLTCDNLPRNGDTARKSLLAFAEHQDTGLAEWLGANVTFPNSMVDRITPRTTEAQIQAISEHYGVYDAAPVLCEPFRQWVLEDNFAAGRPALDAAGVQFTAHVSAYEDVKLRLLNGAHFALAYSAALLRLESVADAMRDEQIKRLVATYQSETALTLHDLPGMAIDEYGSTVRERFGNTTIGDQVARICSEGTAKLKRFIAPQLEELLSKGLQADVTAYVVASWLRYLDGIDDSLRPIGIEDALLQLPRPAVAEALRRGALLGPIASHGSAFIARVDYWLERLRGAGTRRSLTELFEDMENIR